MLEETLFNMLYQLEKHKGTDREELLLVYVNERLNKSFNTYQEELDSGLDYLKRRNEVNVMKRLK